MYLLHRRRWAKWIGATAAAISLAAQVAAAAPASQPATAPSREELLAAVDDLGSTDAAAREKASRKLWLAGAAAEPLLRSAARGEGVDPETAVRARRLLEDFAYGLDPDTPAEVVAIARAYRDDGAARKAEHAQQLAVAGVPGWRVLTRLWERELSALYERRLAIFGPVTGSISDAARLLLAEHTGGARDGDDDRAETLLEIAAAVGDDRAPTYALAYDYVTFVAQRKRLAEATARWTTSPPAEGGVVARVLALLHRAAGDLPAARKAAENQPDAMLRELLADEAGDWKRTTPPPSNPGDPAKTPVAQRAAQAIYYHRIGDADAAALARDAAKASPRAAEQMPVVADAFFYTGQYDEGIQILAESNRPVEAFKLMCRRLRYADAFALADRLKGKDDEQAALVQVEAARELAELGEHEAAIARLDAATAANATTNRLPVAVAIASAEQAMAGVREGGVKPPRVEPGGRAERAALRSLEIAARPEGSGPLLATLWPDDDRQYSLAQWWAFLRRERNGQVRPELTESFDVLRGLVEGTLAKPQLEEQLRALEAEAETSPNPDARAGYLRLLGGTLRSLGRHDEALPHLKSAALRGEGGVAYLGVGDYLADLKRWRDAADWYGRAVESGYFSGEGEPTLLWLHGWALTQTGDPRDAEKGRPMMASAVKLPLGSQVARVSLMITMARRGQQEQASEQLRLINAVPLPAEGNMVWELQRGAWDAIERGQHARAALLFERSMIPGADAPFFRDGAGRLAMPAAIHRLRARALVTSGDAAAAVREAEAGLAALPGDVTIGIDLCEDLDRAAKRSEADAVYQKVAAARRAACEAYPRSAGLRNELAWLQAKCGRDLDEALKHATLAVELERDNPAYIDTLAEVHFRLGDVASAVARMKRCIELDPKSKYFRDQLKRFESAGAK